MSAPTDRIARDAAHGLVWAFLSVAGGKILWLAGMAALARLLAPHDFGLFAFALVTLAYVETVGDLGSRAALIYWPDRTEEAAQVAFLINLAMGSLWFLLVQIAAPFIADFFHNSGSALVVRVLAFSFLLKALGNTHDALCQKRMRFKERLVPELGLALGKTTLAVLLALSGFGVWSLVGGQLIGLSLWVIGLWWVVPWRPRARFPRELLKPMLGYGRGLVAVNVLAAVVHHADLVVVGRMLGTAALGFYQVAVKLPEMTVTVVIWVTSQVLFPTFARIQRRGSVEDLRHAYLTALRYVSLLTLPAAVGLFWIARPLVLVLFGETWLPSVPILKALALYIGMRSLGTHAGDVLKATGRSGLLAALAGVKAALLIPALILAGGVSAPRVAVTLAGVTAVTTLLSLVVVAFLIRISIREVISALRTSLFVTLLLSGSLWLLRKTVASPEPLPELVFAFLVGTGSYLMFLRWLDPVAFGLVLKNLSRRRSRAALDLHAEEPQEVTRGSEGEGVTDSVERAPGGTVGIEVP